MISDKALKVIIFLFLICAVSMPFLFPGESLDDDTNRVYTVIYDFYETDGNGETSRYDELKYVVTRNNMVTVLTTKYYCGAPLAMNVESWIIDWAVNIGSSAAIVVESGYKNGRDCWTCQLEDGTLLSYEKDSGILVHGEWSSNDYVRRIGLHDQYFIAPDQPIFMQEGVLLMGIFIELAIIIWLLSERMKK
jgi:hypothetical protein